MGADITVKEKTATEWTALDGITWPGGTNWTVVNSGKIDLSSYAGKVIQIAFKYEGNTCQNTRHASGFKGSRGCG